MTDREKLEKVVNGLECCNSLHNDSLVKCTTDCPYWEYDANCRGFVIRDALALLKALKPRVLTLDEYRAIAEKPAEERVPVWLEWRGRRGRWAIPERAYQGYGVNWRCWTGKPGEDEREALKWE